MNNTYATIDCTDMQQLTYLQNYPWAACDMKPSWPLADNMRVIIPEGVTMDNAENILTGIAMKLCQHCPAFAFHIHAHVENPERHEIIGIEYHGSELAVKVSNACADDTSACIYNIPRTEIEQL